MGLPGFSIRRPVTVLMVIVAMLIFGFVSLPKMAVDLYPELNLPVAVVATTVEGATPAEVENLVTKPIEEALGTVANVNTISSNSIGGASQVIIQFNWGTDIDQATLDMRDKVDLIRGMLPDSAGSPRILKLDPNSMPIMNLALYGDEDTTKLKSLAENVIKPRLERIEGVASVGILGGQERVIEIVLDPAKMEAYGITLDQIKQALQITNISGSAGSVQEGDSKLRIRLQGEFKEVDLIGETPIIIPGGTIPLKNLATVNDTFKEVSQKTFLDQKTSIGLSITKASGGNTIEVADAVREELEKIKPQLPEGAELTIVFDSSQFIKDSIYTVAEHALLGGLFAIGILYVFLNSFRSMLIVSVVMPISVVATFFLMYFTGQTINLISLAGLMLGLGSLVDFAVVMLENIFRLRQQGKGILEAALTGSQQVGNAVMASALAQIVVFLPIVFVEGLASELFGPLALTVIYSHIAALVVSLMLVPMLTSKWLNKIPDDNLYAVKYRGYNPVVWFHIGFEKMSRAYGSLLKWALKHRKTVFSFTVALFAVAIGLFPLVGMEFIPKMDQGQISISLKLPNGTVLSETEKVVEQIERISKEIPELKQMYTSIGSSGGPALLASGMSNRAQIDLTLVEKEKRDRSTEMVIEELRAQLKAIPDAQITVSETDQSGGSQGAPLQIGLRGNDLDVLKDISEIIAGEVKQVEGTRNVKTSLDETEKEFQIIVDSQKAGLYGLTTSQILNSVRTAFEGQTVTKFRTGDDEIDVRVKFPAEFREDTSFLDRLRITTSGGGTVVLSSVATIVKEDVPQTIKRANQTREVQITSDIVGRDLGSISREIQERIQNKIHLPDGYQIEFGGQSKDMAESFGSLGMAIILSIVLVYMVMAAQFESLFSPFIIMFSIPPTFIGVVFGLLLTGKSLSVPALIGYILLIGIVVNNAIVLIDYINQLRKEGVDRNEAILKAGPIRLRPILMTSLSTTLAILPLAFGGGAGNEGQAPMAIVVAFGLSFSTMITLILIPVVYSWFDDIGLKFRKRKQKRLESRLHDVQI